MTLRKALGGSGWENFKNGQNEEWNTTDLLNEILLGESEGWLDAECTVTQDAIIDDSGDELRECPIDAQDRVDELRDEWDA